MVEVPAPFTQSTVEREGQLGADWVRLLPRVIENLLGQWDLVVDGEVTHGWVAVIVPVRRSTGEPAILKVSFPHPGNQHEALALSTWAGNGAVQLYERDAATYALLLERAPAQPLSSESDLDTVMQVAGVLNQRLTVPAPLEALPLQTRAPEWAGDLERDVAEFGDALPPLATGMAAATIRDLATSQPSILIHGDFHPGNILGADREPWLAIDPKGHSGDPAYDAGMMLRWRALVILDSGPSADADPAGAVERALHVYCEAARVDRARARRWAQLSFVQAAYWGRRHGFETVRGGERLSQVIAMADLLAVALTARVQ